MKKHLVLTLIAAVFILFSCIKEDNPNGSEIAEKEYDLIGSAQKGPFINGSDIHIYELSNEFTPTGRTFHTTTDEKGYFELKGIKLKSAYVEILADGFYFDEVSGDLSNAKLSLKAISDLTEKNNININVLTNLEYDRVRYLIQTNDISIKDAKIQTQKELLKVFNIDSVKIENPEKLDIIKPGEGDAVLLAISAILQSNRTTSELSKLQADIVLDMKEDGILNDTIIQSELISNAVTLNLDKVRQNLIVKYEELGIILENINDFDKYINYYIDHSNIPVNSPFEYPVSTSNGINVLGLNMTDFQIHTNYSFSVDMPNVGKIMIRMKRNEGNGMWWYQPAVTYGWKVSNYNMSLNEQTFTSSVNGEIIDLPMEFSDYGVASLEYYFNESITPFFTKTITWGGFNNSDFQFRDDSPMGHNLLALADESVIKSDSAYTIGIYNNSVYDVNFKLLLSANITVEVIGGYGDYTYIQSTNLLEFRLKGDGSISEIGIKFSGEGKIVMESDLQFKDGTYLARTYFLDN